MQKLAKPRCVLCNWRWEDYQHMEGSLGSMVRRLQPKPKDHSVQLTPMMSESLFKPNTKEWNVELMQKLFDQETIDGMCNLIIPTQPSPDKLIWIKDPK